VFIVVCVIELVIIVITVHVSVHKAHAQCPCTGLTLGVIKILVIPRQKGIRIKTGRDMVKTN
jgi:hypothetical protein